MTLIVKKSSISFYEKIQDTCETYVRTYITTITCNNVIAIELRVKILKLQIAYLGTLLYTNVVAFISVTHFKYVYSVQSCDLSISN